jgi:ribonuclease HIII
LVIVSGPHRAIITFYPKSGSVVIGGVPSPLKDALEHWKKGTEALVEDTRQKLSASAEPKSISKELQDIITAPHIGMDESGKGDWFGPLVISAVFVNSKTREELERVGVRDSKSLNSAAIQRKAEQIKQIVPEEQRTVLLLEPVLYNRQYERLGNINLVLAEAYAQAAHEVCRSTHASVIVCDQFSLKTDRLNNAFATRNLPAPHQYHKAESISMAVAAASILAKAAFDQALQRLGKVAGLQSSLPKGASDVSHLQRTARQIIDNAGLQALGHYAKLNFTPVRALLSGGVKGADFALPIQLVRETVMDDAVEIIQPIWRVNYHSSGFWRFNFADGGILDWYAPSTGKIDVRGKADAPSYKLLKQKAHGIVHGPVKNPSDARNKLDKLKESVTRLFPDLQVSIPQVRGIGWRYVDTLWGDSFIFTDGGLVNYYPGTGRIVIQGRPSEFTRKSLEELARFTWASREKLSDILRKIFPDWELGNAMALDDNELLGGTNLDPQMWVPLKNSLGWEDFWPKDSRDKRVAANGESPCQQELLEDWSSVLAHHKNKKYLLAHAPTGIGKTISSLVPALAWVAQAPQQRRIYYLVNRVSQHENPMRELKNHLSSIFQIKTGQQLRVVDLVGRSQLCLDSQSPRLTDRCRHARTMATWDKLPSGTASWREVATYMRGKGSFCPYHTLQKLMSQAHVVICDYWWLFSQVAQEKEFAQNAGFSRENSILVVDEAHNLADRIRDELNIEAPFGEVENALAHVEDPAIRERFLTVMNAIKEALPQKEIAPSQLLQKFGSRETALSVLDDLLEEDAAPGETKIPIPVAMLRLLLLPDDKVVIYVNNKEEAPPQLTLRLVDVGHILQEGYSRVYASLSMSGTLAAPADSDEELRYQTLVFGLPIEQTLARAYASPFPLRNQRWIYCPDTNGRVKTRSQYLDTYAAHVEAVGRETPGVTAVFFSSYDFMQQVLDKMDETVRRTLIVAEEPRNSDNQMIGDTAGKYEERLKAIVQEHQRAYLFAIYTGKLAEGADFGGNLIKTVVCVSIPMESIEEYHQKLQALYRHTFASVSAELGDNVAEKAKEYAIDRASLSLVLQACGRGIRRENDRCAFLLLDRRYDTYDWRRFLEPRPFNTPKPGITVSDFHRSAQIVRTVKAEWDTALVKQYRKGKA